MGEDTRHLSPVWPYAPIRQAKANSDKRICDPVAHFCSVVEGGLYALNHGAKGAPIDEDGDQPEPTSAGQRKGESREYNEVYKLVVPLRRWGRRLKWPEHCDG